VTEPDPEYSDGSVGRYVREQWTADAAARRSRRRASSTLSTPAAGREPQHATPVSGLEVVPPPDTDSAPGVSESRAAGPDIVRPDAAGSPVAREARVPRTQVPEARTAEHDVAARQAVTDPVTTRPPRAVTDPATTRRIKGEADAPHRISPTPPRGVGRWVDPGAVAAQEAQRARSGMVSSGMGALSDDPADLSSARLLRPLKRPPQSGWRRVVYVLSGKLINPGESPADVRRRELVARINAPLLGCHKIALLSLKGGVGKTR